MLKEFMREIKNKRRSKNTIVTLKQSLEKAQDNLGEPLEDLTYEQIISYIEKLDKELSSNSVALVVSKFIQFYNYCFDKTEDTKYFKLVKELKRLDRKIDGNKLKPSEILLPEDIKKLINVATLERDRCIVAVLFESGIRRGELLSLTNNMVTMDDVKQLVTFEIPDFEGCKTGSRFVTCSDIYGYVQDWQKCDTSDRFMPLSESGLKVILIRLFEKAKIKKPSNPHQFRHSAITYAVNIGMQQNAICMRFWGTPSSDMLDTYIHLSESMQSESYLKAKGMNGDATKVINPLACRCVECGRLIQLGNLCKQCKENADLKLKVSQQENRLLEQSKSLTEMKIITESMSKAMKVMNNRFSKEH
jgi:integrase/recombinase XerD